MRERAIVRPDGLWVLPPELEFGYYVIKKIGKGQLDERHARHLSRLYQQAPEACFRELRRFLPEAAARKITRAAETGDWASVQRDLPRMRRLLLGYMWLRHPLRPVRYYLAEVPRVLERLRRPTGLVVAFLGMDGSGKSTVIRRVAATLAPAFRRTRLLHLRPGSGVRASAPTISRPHAQAPRHPLVSSLKLLYWALGYGWGWIRQVWPLKVASTLVLFDRYYDDLLIDPRRYRFAGPWWLARWLQRVIPRPDLYILLDVPAEVACRRKGELEPGTAQRLREDYREMAARLPRCYVVDAARPLDEVVAAASRVILEFLEARTRRRLTGRI
ncbi:thymidylate kinase-like protein [Rhodothermus marinus]|uniref:thymidylate kinase-like protein n=1 Tax=Rhodothermus marinus TaxID=29549 RepID=UPI0037C8DB2E